MKSDGTITLNKQLYEVPSRFIGQSVDVRFDETGVHIYEEDRCVAEAVPVNEKVNAQAKRVRSPFTLKPGEDVEHV